VRTWRDASLACFNADARFEAVGMNSVPNVWCYITCHSRGVLQGSEGLGIKATRKVALCLTCLTKYQAMKTYPLNMMLLEHAVMAISQLILHSFISSCYRTKILGWRPF
jgi:hypothetical protein